MFSCSKTHVSAVDPVAYYKFQDEIAGVVNDVTALSKPYADFCSYNYLKKVMSKMVNALYM